MDQYFTLDGKPLFKYDPCRGELVKIEIMDGDPAHFSHECREYIGILLNALEEEGETQLTIEGDSLKRALGQFRAAVNDREIFEAKLFALEKLRKVGIVLNWDESKHVWRVEPSKATTLQDSEPELYDVLTRFFLAMGADLLRADQEGKTGWDSEDDRQFFMDEAQDHLKQGRYIGAANFCMFLHNLDEEKKSADQADTKGSSDGS